MERQGGLVDLKLVSKYYPVSNYSYPRKEPSSQRQSRTESRCERPEDRVSFGSDCSVPGMVDDQGSEASNEDDHEYHVTGAELWDSFWQADLAKQQRRHLRDARRGLHPAGIPYPTARRGSSPQIRRLPSGKEDEEPQTLRRGSDSGHPSAPAPAPTWPLPPLPSTAKPKLARKPSYSLFPQQLPTPPRPVLPPRISSLPMRPECSTPAARSAQRQQANIHSHNPASHSISSIRRAPRPKHVHVPSSEGSITLEYLNWTASASAPVSPMLYLPSPPPQTPVSATTPFPSVEQVSPAASRPQSRARRPSIATFRSRSESTASSQPMSSPTFPDTPASSVRPPSSSTTASSYCFRPTTPLTITTFADVPICPERFPPPPPPPNVTSFFDDDSDDEEAVPEAEGFAKRFMRGLALGPHGHKRSHSEGRKSAKGTETAKEQLRRVRADTTCGAPAPVISADTNAVQLSGESDRPRPQVLRKQKSEVFTRVLGRRSR